MLHVDEGKLHAYLDGELSEGQRAELEAHLATCEACRARLDEAKALGARASGLLAELEPGAVHPPAWSELEARASARSGASAPRPRVRPWLAWAASIVLAFSVGWLSHSNWAQWTGRLVPPARDSYAPAAFRDAGSTASRVSEGVDDRFGQAAPGDITATPPVTETQELAPEALEAARPPTPTISANADEARTQPAAASQLERKGEAEGGVTPEQIAGRGAQPVEAPAEMPAPPAGDAEAAARNEVAQVDAVAERRREALPDARLQPLMEVAAEPAANEETRFFAVQPEDAETWLGLALRTIPDLELQRVEVGPGNEADGGLEGLPAVRLVYHDAAGHEIVLTQQRVSANQAIDNRLEVPALGLRPSGYNTYRWYDRQGYLLTLSGAVSSDSLRALASRVR
jgi:hypothetical protein